MGSDDKRVRFFRAVGKDYLAMYLYRTLMEKKSWDKAPLFCDLDEDEKADWLMIVDMILEMP